jgi:hypothetical protein
LYLFAIFFSASAAYSQPNQPVILPITAKAKPGLVKEFITKDYDPANTSGAAAFATDDLYAYLATPDGLFRATLPLSENSSFELIGFESKTIFNLYVHNNSLYVLKDTVELLGPPTDHAFFRSDDHGASFVPMDNGLTECLGGYCRYLASYNALFKDDLIFLNAGGGNNLQVSNDNGLSWRPLLGNIEWTIGCQYLSFELIDNKLLTGGDCTESAYINAGILRPGLLSWQRQPTTVSMPGFQLAGTAFVKRNPGTTDVYAGVYGGLLKSTDLGNSFQFVLNFSSVGVAGPGISRIHFLSRAPKVILIGGQWSDRGFIAYSKDSGETWFDISPGAELILGPPGTQTFNFSVRFIYEDEDGGVFIGVLHPATHSIKIIRLRIDIAAFR